MAKDADSGHLIGIATKAAHRIILTSDRTKGDTTAIQDAKFPGVKFFLLPAPKNVDLLRLDVFRSDGSLVERRNSSDLISFSEMAER